MVELATRLQSYEPVRQFDFEIDIALPGGSPGGESIKISVESAFLPNVTNEEIELPYWNSRIWVAGKASYETGTLTLRDFVDAGTAATIWNWYQKVYDAGSFGGASGGTIGRQSDYKATADVIAYSVGHDGGDEAGHWFLAGVWPTAVNFGTLDYTANDIVKIEVTLRYEHVEWKGGAGGTGGL